MSAVITEQELVAACREILRQWPQARAAVLFGSRARGTQRPDSDWDVAIVLGGGEPRHPGLATSVFSRQQMPDALVRVDAWVLSEDDLRRRARVLGTLPYVICRDGRVLAGEWNGPDPAQMARDVAMNPEDWASRMRLVVVKIHAALAPLDAMAASDAWIGSGEYCNSLLQASADAAELLVKVAMERRGVPADRSHDIGGLAAAFAAQRQEEFALAERMAALNGATRARHMATYEFRPPEVAEVKAALTRTAGTIDLWGSEIEGRNDGMTAHIPDLARFAAGQVNGWLDLLRAPVNPRPDEPGLGQAVAEAALAGRPAVAEAAESLRDRMQRVMDSQ